MADIVDRLRDRALKRARDPKYSIGPDILISAANEILSLRSRCAALEKALEPFAKEASEFNDEYRVDWQLADDRELVGSQFTDLTFGDFRAARAALTEAKGGRE